MDNFPPLTDSADKKEAVALRAIVLYNERPNMVDTIQRDPPLNAAVGALSTAIA